MRLMTAPRTSAQTALLRAVHDQPGATRASISHELGIPSGFAAETVARLVAARLLAEEPAPPTGTRAGRPPRCRLIRTGRGGGGRHLTGNLAGRRGAAGGDADQLGVRDPRPASGAGAGRGGRRADRDQYALRAPGSGPPPCPCPAQWSAAGWSARQTSAGMTSTCPPCGPATTRTSRSWPGMTRPSPRSPNPARGRVGRRHDGLPALRRGRRRGDRGRWPVVLGANGTAGNSATCRSGPGQRCRLRGDGLLEHQPRRLRAGARPRPADARGRGQLPAARAGRRRDAPAGAAAAVQAAARAFGRGAAGWSTRSTRT